MENTRGQNVTLPDEIIGAIVYYIINPKTVLNIASTSKKYYSLLHSKKFWYQNGGKKFKKYAAYWNDQIPSHIVAVIVYIKSLVDGKCSCVNNADKVLANLITKLSTSNDMTDIEEAVVEIERIVKCQFRCDQSLGHKILISGLIPKYIYFLSDHFTPAIQKAASSLIHFLCLSGIHYANVIVQENGVIPLIELMMRTKDYDCGPSAVYPLCAIARYCSYTADPILNIILEPSINLFHVNRYIHINIVVLLAVCVAKSKNLDPLRLTHIVPEVIERMLPMDGSLVDIGPPFTLLARIMEKSHLHPAVARLIVNDAVINAGLDLITPLAHQDEVFDYFTELLRYDDSVVKKMKIKETFSAMGELSVIKPVHMTFLTQLLENKKTEKKMIENILKCQLIAKSMKVNSTTQIGVVHAFLVKCFLTATDEQIQKSVTWRDHENITNNTDYMKVDVIDIWNQVLSYSDGAVQGKEQKKFEKKVYKLMMHWYDELLQIKANSKLSALKTLLDAHFEK